MATLMRAWRRRNVEKVDDIMDDINEEMAVADEISNAIGQPVGSTMFDDVRSCALPSAAARAPSHAAAGAATQDDLLNELNEMEGEMLEQELLDVPASAPVPARAEAADASVALPSAPTAAAVGVSLRPVPCSSLLARSQPLALPLTPPAIAGG